VLRRGLGLRPRLTLRLGLRYLPFLLGVRLGERERGEIVRRGLETDLDGGLLSEASEYGDRVRGRPREGDLDGI